VHIFIRDETTMLVCENRFDPKSTNQHAVGGLGNELIRKRLSLIYPGEHQLEVQKTDEQYSVTLTIPNG
jgi:two-component system LytT family sensor kinase